MLKLDHDRLIDENVALTVEIQNLRATQKSNGPPSDNDDGLSDISTDAARKRLLRMVKRAADGQLVCSFSYVLCWPDWSLHASKSYMCLPFRRFQVD